MIFDKQRWPVLDTLAQKKEFGEAVLTNVIENPHNPATVANKETFMWFLDFFERMNESDVEHLFVTDPIRELVDQDDEMVKVLEREIRKPGYVRPFCGTVSYIDKQYPKELQNLTILLDISDPEYTEGRQLITMAMFVGPLFAGTYLGEVKDLHTEVYSSLPEDKGIDSDDINAMVNLSVFVQQLLFFLDNCGEKTQYTLGPINRKVKTKKGEKHMSRLGLNMSVIDSSYYVTTVRSGGFQVSGHWRMQACGPRRSERRLKWVGEYEKKGYTRKAKIYSK